MAQLFRRPFIGAWNQGGMARTTKRGIQHKRKPDQLTSNEAHLVLIHGFSLVLLVCKIIHRVRLQLTAQC